MKKLKSKNVFLTMCVCSIFLVLGMTYVSFDLMLKGTNAAFGNITGSLTLPSEIKYYSNFPDDLDNVIFTDTGRKEYLILDNMFNVPLEYVFVGWNTESDGTGDNYKYNDQIYVTAPVEFYAQWVKQEDNKEIVIAYGDVNLNNIIDEEDYTLVQEYVSNNVILEDKALKNADVNQDGLVNLIDADIIKQAFLGTDGYTGYFPVAPILKYEIYEEKDIVVETPSDDIVNNNNNNNNSGNNSGSQGNNNHGTGGSNGGGYKPSGGTGSTDNGNNNNTNKDESVNDNANLDNNNADVKEDYEFRYLIDEIVFAITSCNNIIDGRCDLILPKNDPLKDGYIFLGWSEKNDCSTDTIVINSILVDNDKSYYACFIKDNSKVDNGKKANIWIIVISIWMLTICLIYHVVNNYKKRKELN